MALLSDAIARGTIGARPAAGSPGRLYFSTEPASYRDNGSSWDDISDPGGGSPGGADFKYLTRVGNGNYTTTSATMVAIDATNLGYLTFVLDVGDVVRCTLGAILSGNAQMGVDFEVDQPTSANVFVSGGRTYGVVGPRSPDRENTTAVGMFVATEAGTHGFRPVWRVESGFTATMHNATSGTSDSMITFVVEKLGPVAA